MRTLAATAALLFALAVPAGAATVPTKGALESCHTGATPLDRYAIFSAQMGTVPRAQRLQVRFDLLQRLPGAGFAPLAGPGLGVWRSSNDDIFRYRKKVAGMQAPGAYRAIVRFRWLGADGGVVKTARRVTAICHQPDPGADLAVGAIRAQSASGGRVRYLITVRNEGQADAATFDVALTLGTAVQPRATVEGLGAGASTVVAFVGPRCAPGDQLTAQVDPDGRIAQSDRTDDQKVVDCPVPSR